LRMRQTAPQIVAGPPDYCVKEVIGLTTYVPSVIRVRFAKRGGLPAGTCK
jgi:hypothetical protein